MLLPIRTARCRHTADIQALDTLRDLLLRLPEIAPEMLEEAGIPDESYPELLKMVVETIRGAQSAGPSHKKAFIAGVLSHMQECGVIDSWSFTGQNSRQDYRVSMNGGDHIVYIEAKGCGDGNNTKYWDRPTWADEFVVWSLCPESLKYHPGHGIWSAVSTRLAPEIIRKQQNVDALVYFDQRCGSDIRPCPKSFGVVGLRPSVTDVVGQAEPISEHGGYGADWLPPPSIYLFPRKAPNPPGEQNPPGHTVWTCRFANAMLDAFNVPNDSKPDYVSHVQIETELRPNGRYRRTTVYHGDDETPVCRSPFLPVKD